MHDYKSQITNQDQILQRITNTMNNDKLEIDIRDNKVKEGMLLKQSRHLKEWKQRWMVLTKTTLYSFSSKGQYKNPTQIIPLSQIQTIKSYYKDQYKKPFTFRVESPEVNLHMSAKSSDEKWAWMTAIQKMVQRVIHPQSKTDTYNLIRETIKMSTAVRQTLQKKQQKQRKLSSQFTQHLLRKLQLKVDSNTCQFVQYPKLSAEEGEFFVLKKKDKQYAQTSKDSTPIKQPQVDKTIQKPRQKTVQKIVHKDSQKMGGSLTQTLKQLISKPGDNPKPLINFVVYLLTSKQEQYQPQILQLCQDSQSRRFFAQFFLLMMNQETDQNVLNTYLKFLIVIYEHCNQYFYSSDLKALIGILIREIQMNRSEFNQYLIMSLLKEMTEKDWWVGLNYRRTELKNFIKELGAISGHENQFLSQELLQKI